MRASLKVGLITAVMLSCGGMVHAQTAVVGVADADALFHSKNPKYEKNKQAAYHIMKELLEANHWDMADQWLTERYIQHNPQAANGRAAVVKFFTEVLPKCFRRPEPYFGAYIFLADAIRGNHLDQAPLLIAGRKDCS